MMKTYFSLQWKRMMRVFPFVLLVTVVLFVALAVLLSGLLMTDSTDEKNHKFRVGITGDTDNEMLQMGIVVFQNFDDSRYSMEFVEMTPQEADAALKSGDISAYLEVPDDFVEKAMRGDVEPLYYVTSAGSNNIANMVKDELTAMVTDVMIASQKGAYGLQDALVDNHVPVEGHVDSLALEYMAAIIGRSEMVEVKELHISNGAGMPKLYLCSLSVLFLMLLGLPFVAVYARRDRSLNVLLVSRGVSNTRQLCYEWIPHFLALLCLAAVVCVPASLLSVATGEGVLQTGGEWARYLLLFVPVLWMISAFDLFVFELGGSMVSSTLLHFFSALCMCYVSGCFYPRHTFPRAVQTIEQFLPTGCARGTLMLALAEETSWLPLIGLVAYTAVFFVATLLVRVVKVRRWEGM